MVTVSKGYCGFPQLGETPRLFFDIGLKIFGLALMMEKHPEVMAMFKEGQVLFLGSPIAVDEGVCDRALVLRFICAKDEVIKRMWENNNKVLREEQGGNGAAD